MKDKRIDFKMIKVREKNKKKTITSLFHKNFNDQKTAKKNITWCQQWHFIKDEKTLNNFLLSRGFSSVSSFETVKETEKEFRYVNTQGSDYRLHINKIDVAGIELHLTRI